MTAYAIRFTATQGRFQDVRFGAVARLEDRQFAVLLRVLEGLRERGRVQRYDISPITTLEPVAIDASGRAVPLERVLPADELWTLLEAVLSR